MEHVQEDHAWEQAQAKRVQEARAALTDSLGLETSQLRRPLEDEAARAIEVTPVRADKVKLGRLREAYITEVNRLWLYAENTGITQKLLNTWVRLNRRNLAGVDRADYSAEATFAMRAAVTTYQGRAPLASQAYMHVSGALNALRNQALEFHTSTKHECVTNLPEGTSIPEGSDPMAPEIVDDVTPETVLIAKRELHRLGILKEGA